jgi:hypothetical protein
MSARAASEIALMAARRRKNFLFIETLLIPFSGTAAILGRIEF